MDNAQRILMATTPLIPGLADIAVSNTDVVYRLVSQGAAGCCRPNNSARGWPDETIESGGRFGSFVRSSARRIDDAARRQCVNRSGLPNQ
jgi:hypothetical protein